MPCTGGRGKSTLSRGLYNRHLNAFQSRHPRTAASVSAFDHETPPGKLVKKILKQLQSGEPCVDDNAKVAQLRKRLQASQPVLLLLDNMWTVGQVNSLLPVLPCAGSLVIITCREAGVAAGIAAESKRLYRMLGMKSEHALQLFRTHSGSNGSHTHKVLAMLIVFRSCLLSSDHAHLLDFRSFSNIA